MVACTHCVTSNVVDFFQLEDLFRLLNPLIKPLTDPVDDPVY